MNKQDERLISDLNRLKEVLGVSYTHIAKQVGVTPSAITNYCRGMTWGISEETKMKIQKVINQWII